MVEYSGWPWTSTKVQEPRSFTATVQVISGDSIRLEYPSACRRAEGRSLRREWGM